MTAAGSPEWQQYLFIAGALLLIWEIWRGWKLGAVRGLLRLVALFCAWIGGCMAAGMTGTFLALFSKVSPLFAPAVAAVTVGLFIYLVLSFIAGLLFKRTDDHEGMVRFGFGIFGAFFGLIYALMLLWGGITLIRGLGALGELRIIQAQGQGRLSATEPMAQFFIKLKASLEMGAAGRSLQNANPLPMTFFDDIVKASMVTGNQKATQRFIQYPSVLAVVRNPKVLALLQDPALQKAADSRNIFPLLQNKQLLALLEDPLVVAQLKKVDLTAALDFALEPDPETIQMQPGKLRRRVSPISPPGTPYGTNAPSP